MGYELYRRKRGGPWSVYFLDRAGNRFRRSTKQTSKRAATVVADEWYRKRADPTYQAANETSVEQAVRGLMLALEDAGKRPATRRFYREKCGHIARLFGPDLPLARIDAKLVDSYIRDRKREGAARYTISKELTALRQMLKHARRRGEFDRELSQVMPIGFATGYKPRERRLTIVQAWKLVLELPEGPSRYVAFVCATTARDGAVPRARGKHWTAEGVLVLDGKTSRSTRLVPVPPVLMAFVRAAFRGVEPEAMVAPGVSSIRHALDRACKRLGLPHISPNDLRRSVAHWLLEAGVPRDVAAAYMGHANTKMLDMVYGRLDPKELSAALTRALPKSVDVVWTTPALEGDVSDSGHATSTANTCAGGESNTGHADFQSASQTSTGSSGSGGLDVSVESVGNSPEHVWQFCCYYDCDNDGRGYAHERCVVCGEEWWEGECSIRDIGPCRVPWNPGEEKDDDNRGDARRQSPMRMRPRRMGGSLDRPMPGREEPSGGLSDRAIHDGPCEVAVRSLEVRADREITPRQTPAMTSEGNEFGLLNPSGEEPRTLDSRSSVDPRKAISGGDGASRHRQGTDSSGSSPSPALPHWLGPAGVFVDALCSIERTT